MPKTATTTPNTTPKNRKQYNVVFHTGNEKALEAIASAYGANDPTIGKPMSVPQYLKDLALRHIAASEYKHGFDVAHEEALETRTVGTLPVWAIMLPQDAQDKLRAMSKADREAAGSLMMAEAMRHMALENGSVLSEMAKHLAEAPGRAQREQGASALEGPTL